jgi:hypothetical protein
MPVIFKDENLVIDPLETCYIVCFPVVSLKEITDADSQYLKKAYELCPNANYYTNHHSSPTLRGKLGTYTVQSNKEKKISVLNMFIRLYHVNKPYPNDNLSLRLKYFNQCLDKLLDDPSCQNLYFELTFDDDNSHFIQAIEDFWATFKLNVKKDLKITIYRKDLTLTLNLTLTLTLNDTYYLECEDDQISEQPLYEVDFVRYKLN